MTVSVTHRFAHQHSPNAHEKCKSQAPAWEILNPNPCSQRSWYCVLTRSPNSHACENLQAVPVHRGHWLLYCLFFCCYDKKTPPPTATYSIKFIWASSSWGTWGWRMKTARGRRGGGSKKLKEEHGVWPGKVMNSQSPTVSPHSTTNSGTPVQRPVPRQKGQPHVNHHISNKNIMQATHVTSNVQAGK